MKKRDDDDKSGKKSNDAGGGGEGGGERKAQGGTRREEASGSKSSDACSGSEEYRDYGELFLLYTTPQIRTKQSILVKRAMANRSGIQIDQYVIPLIGMGTFGDVGIVMRRKDKKLAAIKICDRVNLDFAKQEVDIQRSLLDNGGDKFITKIYDAFTTKNKLASQWNLVPADLCRTLYSPGTVRDHTSQKQSPERYFNKHLWRSSMSMVPRW